ncbi:MAG: hypothetical protein U1E51_31285 [Candidatus Binatia bacterium]|nr:hypothetical protein [Candidatus Binatia bacterium]
MEKSTRRYLRKANWLLPNAHLVKRDGNQSRWLIVVTFQEASEAWIPAKRPGFQIPGSVSAVKEWTS